MSKKQIRVTLVRGERNPVSPDTLEEVINGMTVLEAAPLFNPFCLL